MSYTETRTETHRPSPARRTRFARLAALSVVAATLATLAGPVGSASALIRSGESGGPGGASFADATWKPTPVFQAKPEGRGVALSTGAMILTPDPTAASGAQTVTVSYYLYKLDANGVYQVVGPAHSSTVSLAYQGRNVPQSFAGSGTIATVPTGHRDFYQIRVIVDWYVGSQWQSTIHLRPNQSDELSCAVSGCTVYVPGGTEPASLGIV